MEKISLNEKLTHFKEHWDPRIIAELNGQQVKIAKFKGEFVWHRHDDADEMFLVINGSFDMRFRDQTVSLHEDEFIVVPRGVEHCPVAEHEVHVMLIEPTGVLNTGNVQDDKTVYKPKHL